jgi:hypothetical protein
MLQHSSDTFLNECAERKFLDTIEDVVKSNGTSSAVRQRLLEVLAMASSEATFGQIHINTFVPSTIPSASGSSMHGLLDIEKSNKSKDGFNRLWQKLQTPDKSFTRNMMQRTNTSSSVPEQQQLQRITSLPEPMLPRVTVRTRSALASSAVYAVGPSTFITLGATDVRT